MRCSTIKTVYPRNKSGRPGKAIGSRKCQLEGCTGVRIVVKWPDGKRTHPCTKGMRELSNGVWILV